ncbi:hypothetical protein HEK616_76390 (plasmid) [Streptomyces nigrescens]|uniref:Uncharacterized protein n=1 Tax=Streptomyces nigrescens TaxID=1920 RepID=A0ABN6R6W8_STRNI|nr:hypothetical protein HEK616_76390 [Streptomyces nigrescens]
MAGPRNIGGDGRGVVDARHGEAVEALDLAVEPVEVGELGDGVGGGGLPAFGDGGLDVGGQLPGVEAYPAVVVQVERTGAGEPVPQVGRSRTVTSAGTAITILDWSFSTTSRGYFAQFAQLSAHS